MLMRLVFLKMEIKRALKRFPQMLAGAIVLLFLAGTIALFSSRALYDGQASGRIPVGVVLPEDDVVAEKVISMISSLDSVKSLCDFQYMGREESYRGLQKGELYAVMEVPEGLVQGIMDGSNPPVKIVIPEQAGLESSIFRELTETGAEILSSAQAGIYAGNQLCRVYGLEAQIPQMEKDLNRIFLSYSLPREDYFRHGKVSATGDLDTASFYGISAYVLILMLCAIPVSGYLVPWKTVMKQKLRIAGIGRMTQVLARVLGLSVLFLILSVPVIVSAKTAGFLPVAEAQSGWGWSDRILSVAALALLNLASAAVVVLVYRLGGSLLGGVMLLFLTVTAQHFLAGGFLPLVFLPVSLQRIAGFLPSYLLMKGAAMAFTAAWEPAVFAGLLTVFAVAVGVMGLLEVKEG